MRILFIAEPASVHVARWLRQFRDLGWDIHIFSASPTTNPPTPELDFGTLYGIDTVPVPAGMQFIKLPAASTAADLGRLTASLIQHIKPDIVHTLGLCVNWENRAFPVALAKDILGPRFNAPWVYSSWGADLDFFAREDEHTAGVTAALARMDFHIAECVRDERLARVLGFHGTGLERLPAFGGATWNVENQTRPSERRLLIFKGRDTCDGDKVGRGLHVLYALLGCVDILGGYRIRALQAGPTMLEWLERCRRLTGLDIEGVPRLPTHAAIIDLMAESRAFIAMTVNDGLPSSLVEAMSLGSYPIHSRLEPLTEWITSGTNGTLVEVEDIAALSRAIRLAVSDDVLVNNAALVNQRTVATHLTDAVVRPRAIGLYQSIARMWSSRSLTTTVSAGTS
jgi:hypothetical protein